MFFYRLLEKSLEISRSVSVGPLFTKYDWIGACYTGLHPYFILGSNTYFFRRVISFGSIFGKRDLLAIDHIMLALFWSYVPNMK